jgi:DNA-directed RNA polymerase specialized sigma24 family protein
MARIPTTSTTLLRDLAQDSQHARWGEFVARYRPMMEAYLRERFPHVDVDDAVQETLIALIKSMPVYRYVPEETGHFHSYLTGILRHKALRQVRSDQQRAKISEMLRNGESTLGRALSSVSPERSEPRERSLEVCAPLIRAAWCSAPTEKCYDGSIMEQLTTECRNSGMRDAPVLPVRKRLDHRGPVSVDVSSAWYFVTICAEGHEAWCSDDGNGGRAVCPHTAVRLAACHCVQSRDWRRTGAR